ncbi:MAG: hypothetical protein JO321_13420 [Solirubrobacterales bacterium]|nr:hypothetical protein [Solirubrobacterales bacterium]MBV9536401.1 hypothetical protein [Solirubrobacterales bacterium]
MTTSLTVPSRPPAQGSLLGADEPGPRQGALDKLIVDAWEGLRRGTSRCPVCGGRLEPEFGAHGSPVGGRCAHCGSTLH